MAAATLVTARRLRTGESHGRVTTTVTPPLWWLSGTGVNPGRRRSAGCGRAPGRAGRALARVFALAALAPRRSGVVPGAGHAIRRPSACTCLVSHHGQDQRTVVVAA